jgi:choline monooxygenase
MNHQELQRQVACFDPDIPVERSWTPPASWYTEPELARLENRAVFSQSWQAVARTSQLRSAGDFVAGCVAGEPWVLTRNSEGMLRALSNVCRHKATQVAVGAGCTQSLHCRYHGWIYDLDGRLKTAPRMGRVADFDRKNMSLPSLGVCTWGPLVLLNGDPEASPPHERLAPLTARLDAMGWERLVFGGRRVYDLACNWKVYCDNYLDGGYHVASLHPGLAAALDLESYRTELFDGFSIQSCGGGGGARIGSEALYAWIYPNLMLNRYGPVLDTNLVVPTGPETCRVIFDFFFDREAISDHDRFIAESIAASELVQEEDMEVCASVQVGLGSAHYDRGRYAPGLEPGIHQFHQILAADLSRGLAEMGDGGVS